MAEYIEPMKSIIEQIMTDFRIKEENHIMKTVADVDIVVDKDRLSQALTDATTFYKEGYRAAMGRPDVVEVVRCKDCQYWEKATVNGKGFLICPASGMEITSDDFCSYGERKDGTE